MPKEGYFIRLHNPKDMRRGILENTRDVLKVLQDYENYKKLRSQRTELVSSFQGEMNEVRAMMQQLKRSLPKVSVKTAAKKKVSSRTKPAEKPDKELNKIEDELADIEKKLGNL